MGRHSRPPSKPLPLLVASSILTEMWLLLVAGHGETATATAEFRSGPVHFDSLPPAPVQVSRASVRTALVPLPAKPAGQRAVDAALSKLGVPYVWGAKGPNVFDCSGLTQWAWRQAGVTLGPDTYSQINQGVPVPPSQVRAGDLVFPFIGHVQLAISATQVVEAPGRGMVVRVRPLPKSFVARRIQ